MTISKKTTGVFAMDPEVVVTCFAVDPEVVVTCFAVDPEVVVTCFVIVNAGDVVAVAEYVL
jgi:hypothetical protein